MNIILGIFNTRSFSKTVLQYDCRSFDYSWPYLITNHSDDSIVKYVNGALAECEICYFDLTRIDFKLTRQSILDSITIKELYLVITTPEYLNKTIFIRNQKKFPREKVLDWFLFDPFWNQFL